MGKTDKMEPCSAYTEGEREADSPALKAHYDLNGGNKRKTGHCAASGLWFFRRASERSSAYLRYCPDLKFVSSICEFASISSDYRKPRPPQPLDVIKLSQLQLGPV